MEDQLLGTSDKRAILQLCSFVTDSVGAFHSTRYSFPGIPCDEWNNILGLVGLIPQHNSLHSFVSNPNTNRLLFMFS